MMNICVGYLIVRPGVFVPLNVDLQKNCHWLCTGATSSGKTTMILYAYRGLLKLNSSLDIPIQIYLADYKGSGDFVGLTGEKNYAEFDGCLSLVQAFYEHYQKIKDNRTGEHILLIFDELPGFLLHLERKTASDVKRMLSEILMVGRILPGGGSAWLWTLCQRGDSEYFEHGARQNYLLTVCLNRVSKEVKSMLFSGEDFPENYQPNIGRGVILIDGRPLQVFQVPKFDKDKMVKLLRLEARKNGAPA